MTKSCSSRIKCSQNRCCQTACSFFICLDADGVFLYLLSQFLVKCVLIKRHRLEKSRSPCGNVHRQCRCSGRRTKASMVKGCFFMTCLRDSRNSETLSGWQRIFFLVYVTTVKKYVPPFFRALRYRMILMLPGYCWVSSLNPTYKVLPAHQLTSYITSKTNPSSPKDTFTSLICSPVAILDSSSFDISGNKVLVKI